MRPDWLGSPQHFVAGALLAFAVVLLADRAGVRDWWLTAPLAIGVVATAEIVVELLEYWARIAHATAYLDTIADLAATLAGALAGTALGLLYAARKRRSIPSSTAASARSKVSSRGRR